MTFAAVLFPDRSSSLDAVFGNVIDLMMARTGVVRFAICKMCSTINLGSAHFCKGRSHKLPAFYSAERASEGVMSPDHQQPAIRDPLWTCAWARFAS